MWLRSAFSIVRLSMNWRAFVGYLMLFFNLVCTFYSEVNVNGSQTILLNMCIIVESESKAVIADYGKVAAAIDLGLSYVQEEILPPVITINKIVLDGGTTCEQTGVNHVAAMSALIEEKASVCHVYLGPGCAQAAIDICNIADTYNIPVIAIPAGGVTTLTGQPRSSFSMMIRMTYNFPAIVQYLAEALNIYVRHGGKWEYEFHELEPNISEEKYIEFLMASQKVARSVVLLTNGQLTRRLMIIAKDLGMTNGGYVFLTVELFVSSYWGSLTWSGDDGRDEDAKQAFDSLILLAVEQTLTDNYPMFESNYRALATRVYNYNFSSEPPEGAVNAIVHAFFDAVVLYANAVKRVHESGQPVNDTEKGLVLAAMKDCSFYSPITNEISMDSDGDRYINYVVYDVLATVGIYETILTINGTTMQYKRSGDFTWPGGIVPVDKPYCGFDRMKKRCAVSVTTIIVGTSVGILFVILAAIMAKYLIKHQHQPDPNWWKISLDELDLINDNAVLSTSSVRTEQTRTFSEPIELCHEAKFTAPDQTAEFRGVVVSLVKIWKRNWRPTSVFIKEMNTIKSLQHPNLLDVTGICLDAQGFCTYVMQEFSVKGTLQGLIEKEGLDDAFRSSFLRDIVEGMIYLHLSPVASHGFLTSRTCHISKMFMIKISDYGITQFRSSDDLLPPKMSDNKRNFEILLWRAPELLRETMSPKGTQKGDIYSFAIIMQEIITLNRPFCISPTNAATYSSDNKVAVMSVKRGTIPPFRPKVAKTACHPAMYEVMEHCWEEQPTDRPTFAGIRDIYAKFVRFGGYDIINILLRKMEEYEKGLKAEVTKKTEQFIDEKTRSDQLLRHMLPRAIADALTNGKEVFPESFPSVTIFFSDIVSFAEFCTRIQPLEIIDVLNNLYDWADSIMESYDVYKVETVAEIFMVASGLPVMNGKRHVSEMANLAIQLRREIVTFTVSQQRSEVFRIRTGMHSGPCVAGIVGLKMPRYCLFGDSVNTASRMQSTGESMKIQVTRETKTLLEEIGGFCLEERGQIFVKGKGQMTTFWLKTSPVLPDLVPAHAWPATFLGKQDLSSLSNC